MQERYIATLDLGSSKIALCVAEVTGTDTQVIYYKETPSDGIRYSCVFNPKRAARAVREAVAMAEDELNIKILQIVVGLPRYGVRQEVGGASIVRTTPDDCITEDEINVLKSIALETYPLSDASKEEIYGAVAQSFAADGAIGPEEDIVGTTADELEGNFKVFVGAKKAIRNIDIMMNELNIATARKYFLPQVVADCVLTEDEKDNGVALIEIGAGVTSLTIFSGGILRHYSSIPFGGRSVTTDIKYECAFNEALAENIKLAYGACQPEKLQSLGEKILQINDEETGTYEQLPIKYLSEIISCRCREIVDAMLFNIQESRYADRLRSGIVITGGGANLVNIGGLIKEMSGYNVRIGFPRTKAFSADGCGIIGETGAAASVGMVMEAMKDEHLNCIEEMPAVEPQTEEFVADEPQTEAAAEPQVETVQEAESYEGTIFDEKANVQKPQKPKKTHRNPLIKIPQARPEVSWKKVVNKVESAIGSIFDMTVGDFYDDMGEEKEK